VDINLYDGADVPALGKVYYKDYDFRGYFVEASGAILTFVEGTGFIYGYLKGFGYTEYTYRNLPGLAFEFPGISGGMMTGKYVGQGIPSPGSFIDNGETDFSGASVILGEWRSITQGKIMWRGEIAGIGMPMPSQITEKLKALIKAIVAVGTTISKGTVDTITDIEFPVISPKTENIFKNYYDK
jgi:hypothetical protein